MVKTMEGVPYDHCIGKIVGFRILEPKLRKEWAKKGSIRIIDVPKDYFQTLFKLEEDYNRALFEGP